MEARRLDRQRRDSAMSSAAETLPSTQDKEFHLRLIDLYAQHPCLWRTSLSEYEDAELKRLAWQKISSELGAHLTPSFVRSRISSMRYRLNVYKLQTIEYKMSPGSTRKPEKLYYIDRLAFLDEVNNTRQPLELTDGDKLTAKASSQSIAHIFRQRVQQQQDVQLPNVLQRLSQGDRTRAANEPTEPTEPGSLEGSSDYSIARVAKTHMQHGLKSSQRQIPESLLVARRELQLAHQLKRSAEDQAKVKPERIERGQSPEIKHMLKQRMHRLSQVELGGKSQTSSLDSLTDLRSGLVNIPSVVRKRMWQQLSLSTPHSQEPEQSSDRQPLSSPPALRALPGESVSMTKVTTSLVGQPLPVDSDEPISDEEEFYRLHWSVRQQQRSIRPRAVSPNRDLQSPPTPPLLLGVVAAASAHNAKT